MGTERWIITGISGGLGRALAVEVLSRGGAVVGGAQRRLSDQEGTSDRLQVLPLELLEPASVQSFVDVAFSGGEVDVLANVAGYGLIGAVEDADNREIQDMFAVNVFGPLRLIQAALPAMRRQSSGHIVNITSIAGRAPGAGSGVYAATKAALEGLSASLAQELAPLGIRVTAVAPGALRTPFLSPDSVRRSRLSAPAYASTVGKALEVLETIAGKEAGDPARAAAAIVDAVNADDPPRKLLLGSDALRRLREAIERDTVEMARWAAVTAGIDFVKQ